MAYYFLDLLRKCVIARLTDEGQAREMIAALGSRYGVIETARVIVAKAITIPTGPAPAGGMNTTPDYGFLESRGIAGEPFVVADILADYDLSASEVHRDASRYGLVTDGSGFVRDVTRVVNMPPPKDYLRVSTDATDDNPPDGYPDIPADGVSSCRIMIQKVNGRTGADMIGPEDDEPIQVLTRSGRLSAVQTDLVNGYAEVTLTSSTDTVIAPVRAYDPGGVLAEGMVEVQFA
jgi:hypothetical protein